MCLNIGFINIGNLCPVCPIRTSERPEMPMPSGFEEIKFMGQRFSGVFFGVI